MASRFPEAVGQRLRGGRDARYVATGHLVYNAAGTLQAVGFDLARLDVTGLPVSLVEQIGGSANGPGDFSVSADGTLVYVPGGNAPALARTLVWVDRQGRETAINAPPRGYFYPRLSPDGNRLALTMGVPRHLDLGPRARNVDPADLQPERRSCDLDARRRPARFSLDSLGSVLARRRRDRLTRAADGPAGSADSSPDSGIVLTGRHAVAASRK